MMSISLATAIIIQNNEVRAFAIGPFANGKFGNVLYVMKGNKAINSIISIQNGEFSTCKAAIDKLDNIVESVRELDLTKQEEELSNLSK